MTYLERRYDDLCEPVEITTHNDLPNKVYLCIRCGLEAIMTPEPTPVPVCLVKGGRVTKHGQAQTGSGDHPS